MPSKTEKQARTMRAAAHDKEFADRMGIDRDVAKEFVRKDQEKNKRKKTNETYAKFLNDEIDIETLTLMLNDD